MSEPKTTYFDRAVSDANDEGGRFARSTTVHVTGSGTSSPLVAPEWSRQAATVPTEPPINFQEDSAMPDMTTASGAPRDGQE